MQKSTYSIGRNQESARKKREDVSSDIRKEKRQYHLSNRRVPSPPQASTEESIFGFLSLQASTEENINVDTFLSRTNDILKPDSYIVVFCGTPNGPILENDIPIENFVEDALHDADGPRASTLPEWSQTVESIASDVRRSTKIFHNENNYMKFVFAECAKEGSSRSVIGINSPNYDVGAEISQILKPLGVNIVGYVLDNGTSIGRTELMFPSVTEFTDIGKAFENGAPQHRTKSFYPSDENDWNNLMFCFYYNFNGETIQIFIKGAINVVDKSRGIKGFIKYGDDFKYDFGMGTEHPEFNPNIGYLIDVDLPVMVKIAIKFLGDLITRTVLTYNHYTRRNNDIIVLATADQLNFAIGSYSNSVYTLNNLDEPTTEYVGGAPIGYMRQGRQIKILNESTLEIEIVNSHDAFFSINNADVTPDVNLAEYTIRLKIERKHEEIESIKEKISQLNSNYSIVSQVSRTGIATAILAVNAILKEYGYNEMSFGIHETPEKKVTIIKQRMSFLIKKLKKLRNYLNLEKAGLIKKQIRSVINPKTPIIDGDGDAIEIDDDVEYLLVDDSGSTVDDYLENNYNDVKSIWEDAGINEVTFENRKKIIECGIQKMISERIISHSDNLDQLIRQLMDENKHITRIFTCQSENDGNVEINKPNGNIIFSHTSGTNVIFNFKLASEIEAESDLEGGKRKTRRNKPKKTRKRFQKRSKKFQKKSRKA